MVKTRTVEMQTQLVGYEFKKKGLPTDKNIAVENSKVSNDYFWKTNEYTDKDVFGRTLDLTALTGIDSEGRVVVNDPNSPKNSEKHWDMDRLLPQIRHIWKFEVEKAA